MKIGIDIDNVLGDLDKVLQLWHKNKYGISQTASDRNSYDLSIGWKCSKEEVIKRVYKFYDSQDFKDMNPIKDAVKGISILTKEHELHTITSRPMSTEKETLRWLHEHFGLDNFEKVHINGQALKDVKKTKGDICVELGIKIMIEDALHYAQDCAEKGVRVLLLDWPWNQSNELHSNIIRVKSWQEILKHIGDL